MLVYTRHESVPPERFLFFRNEHPQSTALGPKLLFGVVSRHFVAAGDPFGKWASGCIQGMSLCQRNLYFFFFNEHAQSSTLRPKLMFGLLSRHFVAARDRFGKRASGCIQLMSLCHRNHFFFFRNEHAQSTTLGSKNSCLGWFRTISLPHVRHCENEFRGASKA